MSDDANLTPEQEADLRRLLAEARHDDPMPEDVAARLDRVLAQLSAGDSELDTERVVELASRRRKASTLLVAAAAIIAIGVGIGQVIPVGDRSGGDSPTSAAADATAEQVPAPGHNPRRDRTADGLGVLAQSAPAAKSRLTLVRSAHFTTDVRHVELELRLDRARSGSLSSAYQAHPGMKDQGNAAPTPGDAHAEDAPVGGGWNSPKTTNGSRPDRDAYECAPAVWGPGRLLPVLYDGGPAVLAFRRPTGDSRVVDLLECGTGDILRSVTLPRG